MPERDDLGDQLRRRLLRQAPEFDLQASLPDKVETLVRRRQQVRRVLAVAAAAVVVAAVAIPLSALRSTPVGHRITPATTPPTTPVTRPLACGPFDLWTTPAGTAVTTTARLGSVTATLTGTVVTRPSFDPALSDARLRVALEDGRHFSETVAPPAQAFPEPSTEGQLVTPTSLAPSPAAGNATEQPPNTDTLCLADVPGERLPTVLLGLYTGYAHCCTVVRAIAVSSTGLSPAVDKSVGNAGASLSPDGADAMVVTADTVFAYRFTSFAFSGLPLELLQFDHGGFADITKQYSTHHPDLVTADAATQWKNYTSNPGNGLGLLAAWVADECDVGQGAAAWTEVDQLEAQGKLIGPLSPTGAAYVEALKTFLAKQGYC